MIIIVQHSKKLSSTGPVGWKFTGLRSKATAGHLEVVYMEEGRSYHQEDPKRQNNFLFCLHAEIGLCGYQGEKELKVASNNTKQAIWALLLSLLA